MSQKATLLHEVSDGNGMILFIHEYEHKNLYLYSLTVLKGYGFSIYSADDLMHDFYLTVHRKWEKFKKGYQNRGFQYLAKALRNELNNQNRSRKSRQRRHTVFGESLPLVTTMFNMEPEIIQERLVRVLEKILNTQEFDTMMHYLDGKEYKEIAAVMECPIGTASRRIHDARRKISAHFDLQNTNYKDVDLY